MSVELNTGEMLISHKRAFLKNTVCKTWYSMPSLKERCLVELVYMEQITERIVHVKPSIFYIEGEALWYYPCLWKLFSILGSRPSKPNHVYTFKIKNLTALKYSSECQYLSCKFPEGIKDACSSFKSEQQNPIQLFPVMYWKIAIVWLRPKCNLFNTRTAIIHIFWQCVNSRTGDYHAIFLSLAAKFIYMNPIVIFVQGFLALK